MQQLTSRDAQFLDVESPTTLGHVGSLVVVDPSTAPGGRFDLEAVRAVLEPRLHLAAALRRRLVQVPLGLGRPYWVDDPHFDIEFHVRELVLPAPGTPDQLGEQVARLHSRPLDRRRPLWEGYVITGLADGRAAYYSKVHHAAIDGASGAEVLDTLLDLSPEPREVEPDDEVFVRRLPSASDLLWRAVTTAALNPLDVLRTVPRSLSRIDELPGAGNVPGSALLGEVTAAVGRALGGGEHLGHRSLRAPRTPFNGHITPHRRFAFGSMDLEDVERVENHFAVTVNDVVMTLTASTLRRWLLDHDALPAVPLVVAVPVWGRERGGGPDEHGNHVSVVTAELPTHIADPAERLEFVRGSMEQAGGHGEAVPARSLQGLERVVPTALSGLAARELFRLAMLPGVPFNLFVSSVPGPQVPLYVAGAKVEALYPVPAATDDTGGLNIALFSYDGDLDFGLIACREMVPDLWNLIGYLQHALTELVELVEAGHASGRPSGR